MTQYIGQIILFAGERIPTGWAVCDGGLLNIDDHPGLYSVIGTKYGGDGKVTFALPDLRGRAPTQASNDPDTGRADLGEKYGSSKRTLTIAHMPAHSHQLDGGILATTAPGESAVPSDGVFLAQGETEEIPRVGQVGASLYAAEGPGSTVTLGGGQGLTIANNGGGQPFSIEGPRLAINFLIALDGMYPS